VARRRIFSSPRPRNIPNVGRPTSKSPRKWALTAGAFGLAVRRVRPLRHDTSSPILQAWAKTIAFQVLIEPHALLASVEFEHEDAALG